MKYLFLACSLLIFNLGMGQSVENSINIMSFNIRYDNPADGQNAWPNRTKMVESVIRYHEADLIGLQEALPGQMADFIEMFPEYDYVGMARSEESPEYAAIFYRKSRFSVLDSGTFWLSETPDDISIGWDAMLARIMTWAQFRDAGGQVFYVFNTHFDHRGVKAREESAKLIVEKIKEINPRGLPTLITGDFNSTPKSKPIKTILNGGFQDAFETASLPNHGPAATTTGWKIAGEENGRRIDYVFTGGNVEVLTHATLSEAWGNRFPSDHIPVMAKVVVNPVMPLPHSHAHNDYEHDKPLWDALNHGFMSVEADIWNMADDPVFGTKIWVIHDRPRNRERGGTLEDLYLRPLAMHIEKNYGRVYPGYDQPFYLMIDLKNAGEATYKLLKDYIKPYEWMLMGDNPPVVIFLSGKRPVSMMHEDPERLMAIDGRPDDLGKGYSAEEMPVISQRYNNIISWKGKGEIPDSDFQTLKELADKAHAEGKKVRLWASPENKLVWETLLSAGIDLINTDELDDLQQFFYEKMKKNK